MIFTQLFFRKKSIKPDKELLLTYQQTRDPEVLGQLFESQIDWLFSVCYGLLKNEMDAEDAVVGIFENLHLTLHKHEIKNFRSWLHSVARNHCLMQLRKKTPFTVSIDESFELSIMDSDESLHQEGEIRKLENCLEGLKPEQNTVIRLFYREEKCYQEISEILKIDLKKVKSLLQNGRRMLKNCIEES